MTDQEIRREIIKLIIPRNTALSYEEASSLIDADELSVRANMKYLAESGYATSWECMEKGFCGVLSNRKSETYLIAPDVIATSPSINIHGNQNIVSGKDLSIANSNVQNEVQLSPDIQKELDDLIFAIKEGAVPKKEQESKVKGFLEKLALNTSSSVLASCALAIFKAALGLP